MSKKAATSYITGVGDRGWYKSEIEQMKRVHKCYRDAMRDDIAGLAHPALAQLHMYTAAMSTNGTGAAISTASTVSVSNLGGAGHDAAAPSSLSASSMPATTLTDMAQDPNKKSDPESYLAPDSCLRSIDGEMTAPKNCPFKDFNTFENTCSLDYWRLNFQGDGHDRFLGEVSQSLVSHICQSQARKELRVKSGAAPIGQFFRVKREHITPLALVLHELKEWATNRLRVASIFEENTFVEIARRIRYVELLQKKEVWGAEKGIFEQGMRPVAHDALFRLLLATKEDLIRAKEYAFRGYSRQRSREKLAKLTDHLKNVIFNAMRVASAAMTVEDKLTDPKCFRLQPTDLLNSSQNQTYVDYTNVANICLRAFVQVPLVRGALLSEYDQATDAAAREKEAAIAAAAAAAAAAEAARQGNSRAAAASAAAAAAAVPGMLGGGPVFSPDVLTGDLRGVISTWRERNLFCVPSGPPGGGGDASASAPMTGADSAQAEPIFLIDDEYPEFSLPRVYKATADTVEEELKEVNKKARLPLKRKALIALFSKIYNLQSDAPRVMRALMKLLASLQDLIPVSYAVHVFWGLAGDGGDITIYDTLRSQIIAVMSDAISRIQAVQSAEHELLFMIGTMAAEHGHSMEIRRLKTRRAEYEPAWVTNFNWIMTELVPYTARGFNESIRLSSEIARDAWDYRLTKEGLNDKVSQCRETVEALLGQSANRFGNQALQGEFNVNEIVGGGGASSAAAPGGWLNIRGVGNGAGNGRAPASPRSSSVDFLRPQIFQYSSEGSRDGALSESAPMLSFSNQESDDTDDSNLNPFGTPSTAAKSGAKKNLNPFGN